MRYNYFSDEYYEQIRTSEKISKSFRITGIGHCYGRRFRDIRHTTNNQNHFHIITGGEGSMRDIPICAGSSFAVKSLEPYSEVGCFEQYYIDFCGAGSDELIECLTLSENGVCRLREDIFELVKSSFVEAFSLPISISCTEQYMMSQFYKLLAIVGSAKKNNSEPIYLQQIKDYIRRNYNSELTLSSIAALVGMSPGYVSNLFSKSCGYTIADFIIRVRLENAKFMLASEDIPIKRVAAMVGYSDPLYFSRLFSREVGMSPAQWKKVNSRD